MAVPYSLHVMIRVACDVIKCQMRAFSRRALQLTEIMEGVASDILSLTSTHSLDTVMATRKVERSFSYGPDTFARSDNSIYSARHGRTSRSPSIFASLLNLLPVRQSTSSIKGLEEETDEADSGVSSTKHDDAWTQAYCNAAVLVLMAIAGCICWAVYCVLEPFLHPLLWAVLIGTILHPFKKTGTDRISTWLSGLEKSSIPLSVGIFLSPLYLFNYVSTQLESAVLAYWWAMAGSVVGVVSLWMVYTFNLPLLLYHGLTGVYSLLQSMNQPLSSAYIGPIQLATLAIAPVLLVVLTRRSELKCTTAIKALSILVWFLATMNLFSYLLGSTVAVPLVISVFVIGAALSVTESVRGMLALGKEKKKTSAELPIVKEDNKVTAYSSSGAEAGREKAKPGREGDLEQGRGLGVEEGGREQLEPAGRDEPDFGAVHGSEGDGGSLSGGVVGFSGPDDDDSKPRVSFGPVTQYNLERKHSKKQWEREKEKEEEEEEEGAETSHRDLVFLVLSVLFLVMVFWTYPFLLFLLVPFAIWAILNKAFNFWFHGNCSLPPYFRDLQSWTHSRQTLLFPSPLPTLLKAYLFLDQKVLLATKGSVSSLMSAFIITSLLVGGLALAVFLAVQIRVELTHYVTMTAAIWNRTLSRNPQLLEWVGEEGKAFQDSFSSFANQGYVYGREWLAGQVQALMGDSLYNNSAVQKQVLNLYDQLYQSYVLKNTSMFDPSPAHHGQETEDDLLNELWIIVKDNYETVISILRSLWSLLSDNLPLAFSLLYTLLELLLSGGTALLNTVVFMTALFYLLCYSGDDYLPVKIVMDLLPNLTQSGTTDKYSASFSRAIRSVFHASMSRSLFYGLYTWLVHTAFGLPVSILPAVLAAIAGALPFINPYWIALPAVLELWLVEGQTISAIAVLSLSLLPVFFVDSVIYGEIEGGHPYLTGLAVAGGIYFAGLEGAIIGPILLCCLIFVHELYGELINHTHD